MTARGGAVVAPVPDLDEQVAREQQEKVRREEGAARLRHAKRLVGAAGARIVLVEGQHATHALNLRAVEAAHEALGKMVAPEHIQARHVRLVDGGYTTDTLDGTDLLRLLGDALGVARRHAAGGALEQARTNLAEAEAGLARVTAKFAA